MCSPEISQKEIVELWTLIFMLCRNALLLRYFFALKCTWHDLENVAYELGDTSFWQIC